MKSHEENLINELKYGNGYIEVNTERRAELIEQLRYAKDLVTENNKVTEELRCELSALKKSIEANSGTWQDVIVREINSILEEIGS